MDSDRSFSSSSPLQTSNQPPSLSSESQNSAEQQQQQQQFDRDADTNVVVNCGEEGSDDNDGFVSGEEEFETASDRPVQAHPDGDDDAPFVNSAEFFTPMVEKPSLGAFVDPGDDNEALGVGDVSDGGVLRGVKLELDGEEVVEEEESGGDGGGGHKVFVEACGVADNKGFESGGFDGEENNGVKGYGSKDEEVVIEENDGVSHDGHHEGDDGVVGTRGSADSVVEALQVDLVASGVAVVGDKEEVEESEIKVVDSGGVGVSVVENEFDPIEQDAEAFDQLVNGDVAIDQNVDTGADEDGAGRADKGQESDIAGSGDSVVEDFQVDLVASGVAVAGDKEEVEESEIKGLEAPAAASGVSVENEFDPVEQGAKEAFDQLVNGDVEIDQNVDAGADEDGAVLEEKGRESDIAVIEKDGNSEFASDTVKAVQDDKIIAAHGGEGEIGSHVEASDGSLTSEYVNPNSSLGVAAMPDKQDEDHAHDGGIDGSDEEGEEMIFGSSEAAKRFLEELEKQSGIGSQSGVDNSQHLSQRIDGQIVTDSEEEADTDDEGEGKQLFDSAALAALLKAGMGNGQDGGGITITSKDGSRLFSVERPAGLGPSLRSGKPSTGLNNANLFTSDGRASTNSDINLSDEEKKKLEKLQQISIKFLRLINRLGFTPEESIAAQVLYRLTVLAGRQTGQIFSIDAAKESAWQLEAEGKDDLNCSLDILVLGKTGVGKSATINSILGEMKTSIGAYGPATTAITEIGGMVDGVKVRIFDTPGLKSSALEQSFNRKVLSMVKKLIKKSPPDIVLYVDRLDAQTRELNDLPLLRSISNGLGPSIWRNAIVALTHAASAPPDGPSGSPLSYDVFVAQRTHMVQQTIGQAVGDLRLMNPSLMNPVALVENHPSCRKNRDGEKVLPNGQSWRPSLLLLCLSMKTLAEAGNLSKVQESLDPRKLFGFRVRSPPLPYLLSWLLQSRTHPKLPADQGGIDNGDSDIELADLSDSDLDEDEDEYDQLLPFKPLKKSQVAKLSREQRKAYFEEYDYRVKLLQKKQWKEELKRMRDMKKKGKIDVNDHGYMEEDDQENGAPASVPVPLPDMALPPSFDSDNPAYRYRFLEPTSQLLTRPVLDTHSWDHDCGYDGVNLEHSLAIVNKFPAVVAVQINKDKKDFSIHLDSSIATKHGGNVSSMAGFDIQNIGKQLAYIVRGETKFKNFKRNKTAAGVSVTFLGENVSTGLKVEDQVALGKRLVLVGSSGLVRSQGDSAYGANVEVRLREADFPIGQDQSSLGLSLVNWRGDLALGANFQSQFSIGRSYKMAVRAGLNNKLSGQISVRTSSSEQLQIALLAILPVARAIYKNFWPKASENDPIYY